MATPVPMDMRRTSQRFVINPGVDEEGNTIVTLTLLQPCTTTVIVLDGPGAQELERQLREARGGLEIPSAPLLRPVV